MRPRLLVPIALATLLPAALAACAPTPAPPMPTASPGPAASPTPAASAMPAASPTPATSPTPSASAPATVSFKADVVPILRARCSTCHRPGGIAPAEYQYFGADDAPNHAIVKAKIGEMVAAVKAGRMPLNAPGSLSAAEVATLEAYRDAGAPDN